MAIRYFIHLVLTLSGFILVITSVFTEANENDCIDVADIVGANYTITSNSINSDSVSTKEITVLRQTAGRMVYLLSTDRLTRVYEHYGNNLIGVTEFYDLEGIGIEYAPARNSAVGWNAIYEFFPASKVEGLPVTETGSWRCLAIETREGALDEGALEATFIKAAQLPLHILESSAKGSIEWQLDSVVTDITILEANLSRIERYKSYDFADLGDSENEDFFRNSEWLKYKTHGPDGSHRH